MRRLTRKVLVSGDKNSQEVTALFDSGATETYIRQDVADKIGSLMSLPKPVTVKLADGQNSMNINKAIPFFVEIDGHVMKWFSYVAEQLNHELIIGATMMQAFNIILDFAKDRVVSEKIDTTEAIG